jgi:N-acetylglutamate synthase-like GNAT family acetyltransferase
MGVEGQRMVHIADRPDLVPVVAGWRWAAFDAPHGRPLARTAAGVARQTARHGTPQCLVLLEDGIPVGTAALVDDDSASRPELGPWLASLVVAPEARGRGHAARLVHAVEAAARESGHAGLWLYTWTAEELYARLGWQRVGPIEEEGVTAVLMRRELQAAGGASGSSRK